MPHTPIIPHCQGVFYCILASFRLLFAMPTEKPKIILVMENDLLSRIDDFRFENRINSRSEAVRKLIEEGLKKSEKKPKK